MYRDNAVKKIARSQRFLIDNNRKFRFEYVYLVALILFAVSLIAFGFSDSRKEDKGYYLLLSQTAIFITIAYYSVSMLTGFSTNFKQRNSIKGSSSINDLYSQFPVTKAQCMKYSFSKWAKISAFTVLFWSVVLIQSIVIERLEQFKGEIGFVTVAMILFESYTLFAFVYSYKMNIKIRTAFSYSAIILIFAYMLVAMFLSKIDAVYSFIGCFKAFSGPLGLACILLNIPIMYFIGHFFVFNTKKSEA